MPLLWVIRRFTGNILGSRSRDAYPLETVAMLISNVKAIIWSGDSGLTTDSGQEAVLYTCCVQKSIVDNGRSIIVCT
jgi:hypothetical protein